MIYDTTNYNYLNPDLRILITSKNESYSFRNAFISKSGDYLVISCTSLSSYKVFVFDIKHKIIIANENWSRDKIGLINYLKVSSNGRFLID